ncbi:MAG: DUF1992 domain-containing protein [Nitrospirota bacterium]|nr:MAG: DUF1992 domain-containing protein [Nitrospirota bacterium]
MDIFQKLAERRITESIEKGELDSLEGAGEPLKLDEDSFVPEELRLSYKVLRNSGFIPPELELRNEIISLRAIVDLIDDDKSRIRKLRELNYMILKLNELRGKDLDLSSLPEYERKLQERML